ncbi:MAG: site-specific DNA-methyltransferase [Anaerolineales bacterium]|jgi:site-specific DNA-methyltransferase (adenine-specific)
MTPKPITQNTLYYGDNLPIMREYLSDESVDLIYLDPPFNSNRSYNVLFKEEGGTENEAQIAAFDDTWHWNAGTERAYHELIQNSPTRVVVMLGALRDFIGANQMMAYLVMMAARLVELHRVLKPTGSLYLHCDPTASHYLKIVLDTIFGPQNFRNEIIWKRQSAHSGARKWGDVHDVLLFYSKSDYVWNSISQAYDVSYLETKYRNHDDRGNYRLSDLTGAGTSGDANSSREWRGYSPAALGRHWAVPREILDSIVEPQNVAQLNTQEKLDLLDQHGYIYWTPRGKKGGKGFPQYKKYIGEGVPVQDTIVDIPPINSQAQERLGYPTQKPLALLERIIQASSNEGDLVLDPFCGCGTAVAAAQKLKRRWIGIDITHLSISLMKYRLKDMFNLDEKKDYLVVGEPQDLSDAQQLAHDDRYQFQWWALSLVQAKPLGGEGGREGKKGSDKGVDGAINFIGDGGKLQQLLIQVKSGHVNSGMIRDLCGVIDREGAAIGAFISLDPPSRDMVTEAVSAGYFRSETWQKDYPRIQIMTVEDLLGGKTLEMPPSAYGTFKKAEKVKKKDDATQMKLGDE